MASNNNNGVSVSFDADAIERGSVQQGEDSNSTPTAESMTKMRKKPSEKAMSAVSVAYDHNGKGYLDETEMKMRELDRDGKGHLDNATVYDLMRESMDNHKKMATQKWMIVALGCFAVLLALANLGTAFAVARLSKDTHVTKQGDLAAMGGSDEPLGTTAKLRDYEFGLVSETPDARRRRLQTFIEIGSDFEYAGHTSISAVQAQELWETHQNTAVNLKWNCGALGQGRSFVKPVIFGSMTPYNGTASTYEEDDRVGILYVYTVPSERASTLPLARPRPPSYETNGLGESGLEGIGGGETGNPSFPASEFTIPVPQYQELFIDCEDGATVCTVANTNCCVLSWDDEGNSVDDCPGEQYCAACGCMCIEPGTIEPRCWSSCDLTSPADAEPIPLMR